MIQGGERLDVDTGIVVDTYLEAAHPGVFAIGDAARWPDLHAGALVRIEHWMLAQRQGEAVAGSTFVVRVYRRSVARVSSSRRPVTFKPFAFW